jgi:chaperone BCS1
MLLADSKDFLRSETWYADRGIPYRRSVIHCYDTMSKLTVILYRGYLLYGTPGSGKSSLIHALAGELALDIYVISLSSSWMNDSTLTNLMSRIPARSILLLEDLDAAFTHSTSRDSDSTGAPEGKKDGCKNKDEDEKKEVKKDVNDQNTLSLSGLLNSLDSIQASEGRILFATTNHLERLDPALSRPGRMDVWVEFKNASKYQAEGLFRNFFPAHEDDIEITTESTPVDSDGSPSLSRTDSMISSAGSFATTSTGVSTPSSKSALISHEVAPTLEHASPLDAERLTPARLTQLAKLFAESIPDEEFSVAALQGYLLKNKTRPEAAANDAGKWVIAERELRERLAREKEERERKAREERERRRKEREERERKEKEEKERKEKEEKEKAEAEAKEKAKKEAEEKDTEKAKSEPAKDEAVNVEKPIEPVVEKAESVAPSEDYEKVD